MVKSQRVTQRFAGLTLRSYLFTNKLLPQEFPGLKHVGDVVERTEAFVFVLILLLKREESEDVGVGGGEGIGKKGQEEDGQR